MRAVIQRVKEANVTIDGSRVAQINTGLVILLGIEENDSVEDIAWMVSKVTAMRIFSDHEGKMNLALADIQGRILVVSQFTLHASTKKGNRPSFIKAARPESAIPLYEQFITRTEEATQTKIEQGVFGADMQVALINDGPVTIILDSKQRE